MITTTRNITVTMKVTKGIKNSGQRIISIDGLPNHDSGLPRAIKKHKTYSKIRLKYRTPDNKIHKGELIIGDTHGALESHQRIDGLGHDQELAEQTWTQLFTLMTGDLPDRDDKGKIIIEEGKPVMITALDKDVKLSVEFIDAIRSVAKANNSKHLLG